uniref:Integrase, catalytic region, zinc finger, CCHC-type, peptidase aspartic, catalytic n=1 Tax=Tanacetum cinerariifolium TaxID=118510 RepID=A0A6L2MTV2_TANCI|nr:hypothetical protein [Tanacetum cinerariifolium]
MEMRDILSLCSNSKEQQMQQIQDKAKESCMVSFQQLHSHLKLLSNKDLKGTRTEFGFKHAFATIFGQDLETFTCTMFLNMDQLEKQLDNEEVQEIGSIASSKDISSRSRNDAHDDDADIRPIYNEEPMAEVQITAEINVFAIGQQHTEQPEFNNEGEETGFAIAALKNKLRKLTVDVNNDLSKPATTHYLPRERESAFAKPHHMIGPSSSRYSSNDMVHNHYLEEAKKKTQESDRNSSPSVMPSARSQSTANDCNPKPRINNQNSRYWPASKSSYVTTKTVPIAEHSRNSKNFSDSKHFVCSTCQKYFINANHDHCVTKFLNEVNLHAKVPSNKTTNKNKPVEQISVAKKPERQIPKGHRFSVKKTSVVHEKTMNPRSCLRWKLTGKIFKTVGLRWVPTGKIFNSSITKVNNEQMVQMKITLTNMNANKLLISELRIHDHNNEPSTSKLVPKVVPSADKTATSRKELELLFHHHITMPR